MDLPAIVLGVAGGAVSLLVAIVLWEVRALRGDVRAMLDRFADHHGRLSALEAVQEMTPTRAAMSINGRPA